MYAFFVGGFQQIKAHKKQRHIKEKYYGNFG